MGRRAGVVVAALLVFAGCGDDADADGPAVARPTVAGPTTEPGPGESGGDAQGESGGDAEGDGCGLVSVDAVADAFGQPAEVVEARRAVCDIRVGDLSLTVQLIESRVDPEDTTLAACTAGTRVEVAAGDAAHVCMTEALPAPFAAVEQGDAAVWIGTPASTEDPEAVLEALAVLLPSVTVPG